MSARPLTSPIPASAFDEIRALIVNDLPGLPTAAAVPQLGELAPVWQWLSAAQHKPRPAIGRPRVALFMAAHGAYPERQDGLAGILKELKSGSHAVSPLVKAADADLQVYELDLSLPSRDFRDGPALHEQEAARAISYGMMAVQPGVDLLVLSALNPAADAAAEEITRGLAGKTDPLEALLRFGGFDIAAMAGTIVAARLARVPVILEGPAAEVSAEILRAMQPDAAAHTRKASILLSEKTHLPPPCHGVMLIPLLKSLALAV
ncbi:MAG: nicotinate-nucleotide--dimethylbenzimidazole phosphoribosyltransferase [Alphaproteobacteria bacterium]